MILLTPEFCLQANYALSVHCARCRVLRDVDLLALAASGREKMEIGKMRFRCTKCGEPGQPIVSGWAEGDRKTWS